MVNVWNYGEGQTLPIEIAALIVPVAFLFQMK